MRWKGPGSEKYHKPGFDPRLPEVQQILWKKFIRNTYTLSGKYEKKKQYIYHYNYISRIVIGLDYEILLIENVF